MRANKLFLGLVILSSACVASTESTSNDLEDEGDEGGKGGKGGDSDACKIEGSQIGEEGIAVHLGAKTVTISDWVEKTGSPNEYVGFSIDLTGGSTISYVIKASGELYPSTALTWMHPNGPDGYDQSPGISNVDFCEECEDGDCGDDDPGCDNPDGCDGGGGDDDPGCDNPDGCDGGGGGGDPGCDNPDGCDDTGGSGPLT
jgi:hypothetical protein